MMIDLFEMCVSIIVFVRNEFGHCFDYHFIKCLKLLDIVLIMFNNVEIARIPYVLVESSRSVIWCSMVSSR